MPKHAVYCWNVHAWADADIIGRVRRGSRHSRIDHDEVRPVQLGALKNMLERYRMGFSRVATHDHDGLGVADVVVAVSHRAVAPSVGYARDGGGMTDARLMIGIVRAPEGGEFAVEIGGFVRELGGAEP